MNGSTMDMACEDRAGGYTESQPSSRAVEFTQAGLAGIEST